MSRTFGLIVGLVLLAMPVRADDYGIKQSPLLMRRAGPSCRPGHLGAQPGAGYFYRLGPCAGADAQEAPDVDGGRRAYRRARPY